MKNKTENNTHLADAHTIDEHGNPLLVELLSGFDYPNIGITVDGDTLRVTFDPKINKVVIVDTARIKTEVRKKLFSRHGIELGIPPVSWTRLEFKDIRGRAASITGTIK